MMKWGYLQVFRPLETVQDHFDVVTEPINHRLGRKLKMVMLRSIRKKII